MPKLRFVLYNTCLRHDILLTSIVSLKFVPIYGYVYFVLWRQWLRHPDWLMPHPIAKVIFCSVLHSLDYCTTSNNYVPFLYCHRGSETKRKVKDSISVIHWEMGDRSMGRLCAWTGINWGNGWRFRATWWWDAEGPNKEEGYSNCLFRSC